MRTFSSLSILFVLAVACGSDGGSSGDGGGGECDVHADCPVAFPWCLGSGEDAACVECLEDRHCDGDVCSASDHTCRGGGDSDSDTDTDTDTDTDSDTGSDTETECLDEPMYCLSCAQTNDCVVQNTACVDDPICGCYLDCLAGGGAKADCLSSCGAEGNAQCNDLWACFCSTCGVCGYSC